MYKVSILTIGDEICIGQVVNSNAAWIAAACSRIGASVVEHRTVGDERKQMLAALRELHGSSHCVLITGGLGPTHDDITKDVLCDYFDDVLTEDVVTVNNLIELFRQRNRELTPRNRAQALLPSKAVALQNRLGSAPGLLFRAEATIFVAMPGVPNEMKSILADHVLPLVAAEMKASKHEVMMYHTLFATGIAESTLADLIGEPHDFLEGQQLAFLPSYSGVRLRISVRAANVEEGQRELDRIAGILLARAGEYVVAEEDLSLSIIVHRELMKSGFTLALAESCTGGMLGMQLTDNPGSSQYFLGGIQCYSNVSKVRDVGIDPTILEQYGAVSRECVEALAISVRSKFGSDFALAISGIAGPDGATADKAVGTIWIACADSNGCTGVRYTFGNDRAANRERACATALLQLLAKLRKANSARLA